MLGNYFTASKKNKGTMMISEPMRKEWFYWCGGGFVSMLLANFLLTESLVPSVSIPFIYSEDGIFHAWMTQRVIEGWLFDNPRNGYPFDSLFLDYPGSDFSNHILLKFLGFFSNNFAVAMNLYILLGFFFTFSSSYVVFRALNISIPLAFAGAFIFNFLPFHFLRLNHLFYTWYFVVPLYFYLGFICFNSSKNQPNLNPPFSKFLLLLLGLIIIAGFGVYYAFFGVIVLCISGLAGLIAHQNLKPAKWALGFIAIITIGVLLNLLPNIVHNIRNGTNIEVAKRLPMESEIYGLKLIQLISPRPGHRNNMLASFTSQYSQSSPLVNENHTATLGIIGSIGLIILFSTIILRLAGRRTDERLALLSLLVLSLFLFGTIGGLGSLFANAISPSIRAWNRISVFIGFGTIAGFLILFQVIVNRCIRHSRKNFILIPSALALMIISFYDQTTAACLTCIENIRRSFENDRAFVRKIEMQLPKGGAVYQLPYMPFPEVPPQHDLPDYGLALGFLHSKDLHWSYGGMKGRPGDFFFRGLAQEPINRQIEVIKKLGFSGIYIDRRGYSDKGNEIIRQISNFLGYGPSIEHADGKLVFFPINDTENMKAIGSDFSSIVQKFGYHLDHLGRRHDANLADGLDFTRRTWPSFIRDVRGLSDYEPWGRWSDANLNNSVRFDFFSPLPDKFNLVLLARPFGPDGKKSYTVKIGNQVHDFILDSGQAEVRIPFYLNNTQADSIEFIPQNPVSPYQLGISGDKRKIGLGFVSMKIDPIK